MRIENSFYTLKNGLPSFKPDYQKFDFTVKHFASSLKSKSWRYLSLREMARFVNNNKLIEAHHGYLRHRSYIKYSSPQIAKITIKNSLIANEFALWNKLSYSQMKFTIKNINLVVFFVNAGGDWEYLNFRQMIKVIKTIKSTTNQV